jgi:formylglycine-generating enzyme required for sulfatase activity
LSNALYEALADRFRDADNALSFEDVTTWLDRRVDELNSSRSANKLPKPARLGYGKGMSFLTRPPDDWVIHQIDLPNETPTILAPLRLRQDRNSRVCAIAVARHPVTNWQYRQFVYATDASPPSGKKYTRAKAWHGPFHPWDDPLFSHDEQPVTCVTLADALKYCSWLCKSVSKEEALSIMLPSDRIFRLMARGQGYRNANVQRIVHHNDLQPARCVDAPERTSTLGITDIIGNVWEWGGTNREWARELLTTSQYQSYVRSPYELPRITARSSDAEMKKLIEQRVIYGGSFLDTLDKIGMSYYVAGLPDKEKTSHNDLGFRICATIPIASVPETIVEILENNRRLAEGLLEPD